MIITRKDENNLRYLLHYFEAAYFPGLPDDPYSIVGYVAKLVFGTGEKYQWFLIEVFVNNKEPWPMIWKYFIKDHLKVEEFK